MENQQNQTEMEQAPPFVSKRVFALLAVCALLSGMLMSGVTYAWFTAKDQKVNKMKFPLLSFEIVEPSWKEPPPLGPGDMVLKDPQIVNTGDIPIVVRIRLEEAWVLREGKTDPKPFGTNPDYVKYYANNIKKELTPSDLMDATLRFMPRAYLEPNYNNYEDWIEYDPPQEGEIHHGSWIRGQGSDDTAVTTAAQTLAWVDSEWLYYDKILQPGERTDPVFRAVMINPVWELGPDVSARISDYELEVRVYAETVQALAPAWNAEFGIDIPEGWDVEWGAKPGYIT